MKFVKIWNGHMNPRTVEVIKVVFKQYGWTDYEKNEDGSPKVVDGMPIYRGGNVWYDYVTVQAVLTSGTEVVLELWDTRTAPDVDSQERLDYWLQAISEAME